MSTFKLIDEYFEFKVYPKNEKYFVYVNGVKVAYHLPDGDSDAKIDARIENWRRTETSVPSKVTIEGGKGRSLPLTYYIPGVFYPNYLNSFRFLPPVRQVTSQLISQEIISVQPMTTPTGLLFFMDFVYNKELNND